jgi:hypothetical protein
MEGFKLNLNTIPPAPPAEETQNTENVSETPQIETKETPTTQAETPQQETKPDEFFDNFNKRFNTQFKADEDVKAVLGLQKTVDEYRTQLQDKDNLVKSIEEYKNRIKELEEGQDPLKWFSSPETYVAEQLRIKYPKSNPILLQEIATSNVDEMDDFDVLVKEKQLFVPKVAKEGNVKAVILKKYGLDADTNPQEWDEIAKTEMAIDAAAARDKINDLKKNIEMPKVLTKEQRLAMESELISKREKDLAPHRENFNKFDKFSQDGFEFDVPSDFKSNLSSMFDAMFVKAGMEPTAENIQYAVELRDALFLKENFAKIRDVIAKEAEARVQAKIDEKLHNAQPPNTATADEHKDVKTLPGLGDFLNTQKIR